MSIERNIGGTAPNRVYDPVHRVWDLVEELPEAGGRPREKFNKAKFQGILQVSKGMGAMALAAALSYGAVHTTADFAGRKVASVGGAEVHPGTLWDDLVENVPRRLGKGF